MKPYTESCDQNRDPILAVLSSLFADSNRVLEIGSGTGQHAVYFSRKMPHLLWHTSDRAEHHTGIRMWLQESGLANVRGPLLLDVRQPGEYEKARIPGAVLIPLPELLDRLDELDSTKPLIAY